MSKKFIMCYLLALSLIFVSSLTFAQSKQPTSGAERMQDATQSGMAYASLILSLMLIIIGPTIIVWIVCKVMKLEEAGFLSSLYTSIIGFLAALLLFYSVKLLPDAIMSPKLFYENTELLLRGLGVIAISFVAFLMFMKQRFFKTLVFTIFYCVALYFAARLGYMFIDSTGATSLLKGGN